MRQRASTSVPATAVPRTSSATVLLLSVINWVKPEASRDPSLTLCLACTKTVHLLSFIDVDDSYRRRTSRQLTISEGRHQLGRNIFHGHRGQLRQAYREGQDDQLSALGLVLNAVVLWNTVYMDTALQQLRAAGQEVRDDDVVRLSPLGFKHLTS